MTIVSPQNSPDGQAPATGPDSPTPSDLPVAADPAAIGAAPGQPSGPEPQPAPLARSRWLRYGVPIGILGAGAIAAAVLLLVDGDDNADAGAEPVVVQAVEAEQRDLIEFTDLEGTLTWATTWSATAGSTGTVTALVDDGDLLTRGDVAFEIDAQPVTVLYGDVPLYRPLSLGDEGDDVLLLEQNLASLGHHTTIDDDGDEVDTDFTVDGVFDAATVDAVERWQADLGLPETGTVQPSQVVVVSGPAIATDLVVEVGSRVQETSPILSLDVTGAERGFHGDHAGEVELQVTSGPIENGAVVYTVDDLPITAMVVDPDGDVTFDRDLRDGVTDGDDVEALEEMLVSLGYDADGDLDVDTEFDEDTTEAISDWQEDLQDTWEDVVVDGDLDLDDIVVVDPGTSVDTITDRDSDLVARGSELFVTASTEASRVVTTSIPVADQDTLVEGQEVEIEFPDGQQVTAVVATVATSSTIDPTDPSAEAELAVEITVAEVPESAAGFSQLDVEVKLVDEVAAGATVVPVSALVATGNGYAVEVVGGGSTQFVAVEPGMFADGFVEVDGIEPGTTVVIP